MKDFIKTFWRLLNQTTIQQLNNKKVPYNITKIKQ